MRAAAAILILLVSSTAVPASDRGRTNPERLLDDVRYLTSPALGGRATGSPGLTKAADYIASQFVKAGVKPVPGTGYLQQFTVTAGAKLGSANSMEWADDGKRAHPLGLHTDFEPFAFSGSGDIRGKVVFAGYGITACEYGYDDYAGVDATGKVVVILRHEPQEFEASSPFEGRVYTEHSQILRKLLNAQAHGAKAVLLVSDVANHSGPETLEKISSLPSPGGVGLPFAGVRSGIVEQWFALAARSFAGAQEQIDKRLEPASFEFPASLFVHLRTDVDAITRPVSNVVAYLPGTTSEYVVAGAHYDHLGLGEQYSLAAGAAGTMHPGADDNASGTAAVLALARRFSEMPRMRRGILFILFAGEEIGLLGSTFYTSSPLLPLGDAVAMINMDMIGRLRDHSVIVGGVDSADRLRALVEAAGRNGPLRLQLDGQAVYGSSDHTTFVAHGIPALFFFTGLHADYHRPTDTADKIDGRNLSLVAGLVGTVTLSLAQAAERPVFRTVPGKSCGTGEKFAHTAGGTER